MDGADWIAHGRKRYSALEMTAKVGMLMAILLFGSVANAVCKKGFQEVQITSS